MGITAASAGALAGLVVDLAGYPVLALVTLALAFGVAGCAARAQQGRARHAAPRSKDFEQVLGSIRERGVRCWGPLIVHRYDSTGGNLHNPMRLIRLCRTFALASPMYLARPPDEGREGHGG